MFSQTLRIVFKKEIVETLRDRRSMMSALLIPVLGAGLLLFLIHKIGDRASEVNEVDLHVQGAQYAPALIDRLERKHITIKEAPEDPVARIKDQSITALLVIPESYDRDLAQGNPVPIAIKADLSNALAKQTVSRAQSVISAFGTEISVLRLAARGVAMHMIRSFDVQKTNLATDQQKASTLTSMILLFALLSAFAGGMYVCIDSTAGERERKSLEPLLNTPSSTLGLAAGKWLAAASMAVVTTLLTLFLLRQALLMSPYESLGLNISLGLEQTMMLFFCIVPIAFLGSSAQLILGIYSKTYREAQTYGSLFMLLPMMPTYLYDADTGPPEQWMHAVPTLSQYIQGLAILRGEAVPALDLLMSAGTCLVVSPCLVLLLARLLQQEKIIYGR